MKQHIKFMQTAAQQVTAWNAEHVQQGMLSGLHIDAHGLSYRLIEPEGHGYADEATCSWADLEKSTSNDPVLAMVLKVQQRWEERGRGAPENERLLQGPSSVPMQTLLILANWSKRFNDLVNTSPKYADMRGARSHLQVRCEGVRLQIQVPGVSSDETPTTDIGWVDLESPWGEKNMREAADHAMDQWLTLRESMKRSEI